MPGFAGCEKSPAATWAGDRTGGEMPACSRLLPRIIPPANGEVGFQISGPQVHGSFETKLCQIYGFGVLREETVAILSKFCLELSDLNRRLCFQIGAQKVFVVRVLAKRYGSLRKAKQAVSTCPREARLLSTASKRSSPTVFINSYKARENPHVIPFPNSFPLKQKTVPADCMPFTLDAVKDFAGCCTKTSHAVFTELNIIFFFSPYLNFNI